MYPAKHHQLLLVTVIEKLLFIQRLAGIACARLLRDDQASYEKSVGFEYSTQHTTCLEVQTCVGRSRCEELIAKLRGKEDRSQRIPVFEEGRWLKGEFVQLVRRSD